MEVSSNGNRHQWQVWSAWKDFREYEKDRGRFVTEFGFQAPANLATFEDVIAPEDRTPQSVVMEHHNKQVEGTERLIRFLSAHYRLPARYEDFVYTGQLLQGEALKCGVEHWRMKSLLLEPKYPWESMQIGNCGSPIETSHGWILLTHGVGPMRRYCIGAVLLDLENPLKVIGRLRDPLIEPDETEREGYVPNVVYTCGAMPHAGRLIIPYAVSDFASRFGSVDVEELVGAMKQN